jgi:hypothetical protein
MHHYGAASLIDVAASVIASDYAFDTVQHARDRYGKETRALRIIYGNAILGDTAIFSGQGVQIGGGVDVEWGGVMSPYTIAANSKNHPQFWSASQITTKDTSANPPNCDSPGCCQWHAYQANLPSPPLIDFDFYRASAAATSSPSRRRQAAASW